MRLFYPPPTKKAHFPQNHSFSRQKDGARLPARRGAVGRKPPPDRTGRRHPRAHVRRMPARRAARSRPNQTRLPDCGQNGLRSNRPDKPPCRSKKSQGYSRNFSPSDGNSAAMPDGYLAEAGFPPGRPHFSGGRSGTAGNSPPERVSGTTVQSALLPSRHAAACEPSPPGFPRPAVANRKIKTTRKTPLRRQNERFPRISGGADGGFRRASGGVSAPFRIRFFTFGAFA